MNEEKTRMGKVKISKLLFLCLMIASASFFVPSRAFAEAIRYIDDGNSQLRENADGTDSFIYTSSGFQGVTFFPGSTITYVANENDSAIEKFNGSTFVGSVFSTQSVFLAPRDMDGGNAAGGPQLLVADINGGSLSNGAVGFTNLNSLTTTVVDAPNATGFIGGSETSGDSRAFYTTTTGQVNAVDAFGSITNFLNFPAGTQLFGVDSIVFGSDQLVAVAFIDPSYLSWVNLYTMDSIGGTNFTLKDLVNITYFGNNPSWLGSVRLSLNDSNNIQMATNFFISDEVAEFHFRFQGMDAPAYVFASTTSTIDANSGPHSLNVSRYFGFSGVSDDSAFSASSSVPELPSGLAGLIFGMAMIALLFSLRSRFSASL